MNSNNASMVKYAFAIANHTGAKAIILHADSLDDFNFEERVARKKVKLLLLSRKKKLDAKNASKNSLLTLAKGQIILPKISLTRVSMMKVAATLAFANEMLEPGGKIVFAVGDNKNLDLIQVVDTAKNSEIITGREISKLPDAVSPELFQSVLNLAIELADKGREGKPIGTIFVLGDEDKVLQLSKQMILNPFKGYDEEDRHILSSGIKETIREFSALDGAFVIADNGTLLTAGRYLGAAIDESSLPRGLGSRHLAAAGITSLTKAVAFAISESSGDVRIFKEGKVIMHIEKAVSRN